MCSSITRVTTQSIPPIQESPLLLHKRNLIQSLYQVTAVLRVIQFQVIYYSDSKIYLPLTCADQALPDNNGRRKSQRHWGFGRQNDPEALKKRRASQDEKDRLDFAAARKYSSARRRSHGAGTGFEGGWQ